MCDVTIQYTDYALEYLCSDLEWELVKLLLAAWDGHGDATRRVVYGSSSQEHCGQVLLLQSRSLADSGSLQVTASMAGELAPQYHGVGIEWDELKANLAVGSGDPLGLLWEYQSRRGHRPMFPSSVRFEGASSLAA
ncbi:MAG: hypothetical protein M3281_06880 [Chloroflexota bacterium]|nr:hypothetical protein [Chloroflexota bacterium]